MMRTWIGRAALVAALSLAIAGSAGADWLVLTDGSRVETDGTWEVKGRQIVFRTAEGTLSSLKTEQVDLEASREATRAVVERTARPAPPPPPAPRAEKPRRKWTNADIPRGAPPPPEPPPSEADEAAPGEAAEAVEPLDGAPPGAVEQPSADPPDTPAAGSADTAAPAITREPGGVVVTAWDRRPRADGDGIEIAGTLANDRAGTTATSVRVEVVLYDRSGEQIAAVDAGIEASSIPDGGNADFIATFPDVYDFGAVRFNATSLAVEQAPDDSLYAVTPN